MKILIFVILLGFTGHTFAGDVSKCGPLLQSFTPLIQIVEYMVDFVEDKINCKEKFHFKN